MKSLLLGFAFATLVFAAAPAHAGNGYGHSKHYSYSNYGRSHGYRHRNRHGYRHHRHGYRHGYRGSRYGYRHGYRGNRYGYRSGHRYGYRHGYRNRGYYGRHYRRSSDRAAYAVGGLVLGALIADSANDRRNSTEVIERRVITNAPTTGTVVQGALPAAYYRRDGSDCLFVETKADGRRVAEQVDRSYCE